MKPTILKKLTQVAVLGIAFFVSASSWAYPRSYWARRHDPWVDTKVEHRYDLNHNGKIGRRERYAINHRFVNNRREFYCDHNHNGVIGPHEARCAY